MSFFVSVPESSPPRFPKNSVCDRNQEQRQQSASVFGVGVGVPRQQSAAVIRFLGDTVTSGLMVLQNCIFGSHELAPGSDPWPTAEKVGWKGVGHRPLAGGGESRRPKGASNYWRIAYASAKEVDSHLRLLAHAGAVNRCRTNDALEAFDQVRAMTWRLLNPIT